jgi:hypothetical protein
MPKLIVWILDLQRFDERTIDIQACIGYRETLVDKRTTTEITAAQIYYRLDLTILNEPVKPLNIWPIILWIRSGTTRTTIGNLHVRSPVAPFIDARED